MTEFHLFRRGLLVALGSTGALLCASCESIFGIEEPELLKSSADAAPEAAGKDADAGADMGVGVDAEIEDVKVDAWQCTFVPAQNCTAQKISDCANFGCGCADNECGGGLACDYSGCSVQEAQQCLKCGCACVDHQCSGGYCPGTGCTAKEKSDCSKYACDCVDHKCSGGLGCASVGSGCTARETDQCAQAGCGCANHTCTGGKCV